jgi:hypothetical protein
LSKVGKIDGDLKLTTRIGSNMGLAFYYCEPPEYHRLHVIHELAVKLVEARRTAR